MKMDCCPVCNTYTITSGLMGEYCGKCGLILNSYNKLFPSEPKEGKCRICKTETEVQEHHIIPKRTKLKTKTVSLCKRCHRIADLIANVLYPKEIKIE